MACHEKAHADMVVCPVDSVTGNRLVQRVLIIFSCHIWGFLDNNV